MDYSKLEDNSTTLEMYRYSQEDPNDVIDLQYLPPEYVSIEGYKEYKPKYMLYCISSLLSFGILPIIAKQYPKLRVSFSKVASDKFRDATSVLVLTPGERSHYEELEIKTLNLSWESMALFGLASTESNYQHNNIKYFEFRRQRYIYKEIQSSFQRIDVKLKKNLMEISQMKYGLSEEEAKFLLEFNGKNDIEIQPSPIIDLLFDKLFHPFYVFQLFSTILC
ncbi:hypothetical protein HDU92_002679 [Lobulomyces angularis]|nr:hypothetical protein HDU92_002679 [Lobulomyces angularis]